MKWLSKLALFLFGIRMLATIEEIIKENRILIVNDKDEDDFEIYDHKGSRHITELRPEDYNHAMDLRGTPTHECVCGCNVFNLKVMFHEGQISQYFLDMECASCGSLATAPTPIDDRNELD